MHKILGFVSMLFVLSGCYQTSFAPMIGPAASASQGRVAYSAISSGVSYGVKQRTGKFPIEHILQKEKDKVAKKFDIIEGEIVKGADLVKKRIIKQKNNVKIKDKVDNFKWVLHLKEIKTVKQEEAFPANKPRYSYWSN